MKGIDSQKSETQVKITGYGSKRRWTIMDRDETRSLARALKKIWDRRVEKGEIEITVDESGRRIIAIR